MFHELPRLVAGHASSSLAAASDERLTRLQPDIDRQRLVIDPKYDTCTKWPTSISTGAHLGIPLASEATTRPTNYYCHIFRLFMPAGLIGYSEPIRSGKQVRTVAW
jgi:hypothetical protein